MQIVWTLVIGSRVPTVGASGALFGLLLAFGMLFPNRIIMPLFPPIPMKAKIFVAIFGALELVLGVMGGGGVAHFAHLGGMLGGFLMIRFWRGQSALRPALMLRPADCSGRAIAAHPSFSARRVRHDESAWSICVPGALLRLRSAAIALPPPTDRRLEAQSKALERAANAVVGVQTLAVPMPAPTARSAACAKARASSSDADGLVLTIGYLILEADQVQLVLDDERVLPGARRRLRPGHRLRPAAAAGAAAHRRRRRWAARRGDAADEPDRGQRRRRRRR